VASVQELKDALQAEQLAAIDVADRALDAINTLLTLSGWTITILAFVVGLIAIFGYALIASSAKNAAKKVATDRVDSYIKSQEFHDSLEVQVRKEVKERLRGKMILANLAEDEDDPGPDAFPNVSGGSNDQSGGARGA
jgi:hypothetical protein